MPANIERMEPEARKALQALLQYAAAHNYTVSVADAWRSRAAQEAAYKKWLSGKYNVPIVAKPGTSKHETGEAFDLSAPDLTLKILGDVWLTWGGKWGGTWSQKNRELWHFEYTKGMTIPETL